MLNLYAILPVYFVDTTYLSAAVTSDKYCTFGWVQGVIEN